MREAIGMIELTSIGIGYKVQDAMLKAADVALVLGRTICSGKYINLITGSIAAIEASMATGLDAAPDGVIDHITITTRKPLRSLEGAPFIVENGISLEGLTEETELYSGPVREAMRGFPSNVNVAACVSMAGIGADETTIRILAVPGLERNSHTIEVEGEFGSLTISIANALSENPKTGRLTAMSIIRTIKDLIDPFRIGT